METGADYAWALAVVGGPILLAGVIVLNLVRSRRRPKAARDATAPRSYEHATGGGKESSPPPRG
jgi:hypothetical protein